MLESQIPTNVKLPNIHPGEILKEEFLVPMNISAYRLANVLIINCSPVKNGATAEIVKIAEECIKEKYDTTTVCIDDYKFNFCKGCRTCHSTAKCIQHDDFDSLINEFEKADIVICVSPSYWADVPGQFKAFIDRCTPWCNTHEPHASLSKGKKGYSIVLRTGPNMKECERLISTIEHFYGHMEIESVDRIGFCSIEFKEAVNGIKNEIIDLTANLAYNGGYGLQKLRNA